MYQLFGSLLRTEHGEGDVVGDAGGRFRRGLGPRDDAVPAGGLGERAVDEGDGRGGVGQGIAAFCLRDGRGGLPQLVPSAWRSTPTAWSMAAVDAEVLRTGLRTMKSWSVAL